MSLIFTATSLCVVITIVLLNRNKKCSMINAGETKKVIVVVVSSYLCAIYAHVEDGHETVM